MGCGSSAPAPQQTHTAVHVAAGGAQGGGGAGSGTHRLRTLGPWVFEGGAVSQFQLQCMREEFWEKAKAPGRNIQTWDALKVACEAMANGNHELAETVLQTAHITTANGTLQVCFDHRRQKYDIPRFCWCTPVNIRDGVVDSLTGKTEEDAVAEPLAVSVRVAFTEVLLKFNMSTQTKIAELKAAVHQELEAKCKDVDDSTSDTFPVERQRMFFGGRELRDVYTLAQCGLKNKYVVQVTGVPTQAEQKAFMDKYA